MAKKIALFVGQIIENYQNGIAAEAVSTAERLGYTLEVFSDFGSFGENYLHADGEKNIINLPYFEDYDGIILAPDTFDVKGMYEELSQLIEQRAKCPVVCLRYEDTRFYNVMIDDYAAMQDMVEHFVTVHHFQDIFFMTGKLDMLDAQRRLQAYKDTMAKYNLPISEHMIFEGDYWRYRGEEAVKWFLEADRLPQAIVCSNDYMAFSVCDALRKRGYKVPGDVSVSGFDNIDEAKYSEPPVSSVEVPVEAMARMAVETIDKILKGGTSDQYLYVAVKGSYQGTCGCEVKEREKYITDLYNQNRYLELTIQTISYMNVDYENCNSLDELFHTAYVYSFHFFYDNIYICLCDTPEKNKSEELVAAEQYTENITLRAILSRNLGLTICNEQFNRRELLPEKYKKQDDVLYLFPLHYKNSCLGYLALQTEKINNLKYVFSSWTIGVGNFIDKISTYSENKQLLEFREQSLLDELTGMHNRRMLEKELRTRSQKAFSHKISFCVINIDMDGLKRINDTYGHAEGDAALCALAGVLMSVQNERIVAARVGGDEFTVCYDTGEEQEVQDLVSLIEERITGYNKSSGKSYRLSASIGYAFYKRGRELSDCMERADRNMYANKNKKKLNGDYPGRDDSEDNAIPSDPVMLLSFVNLKLRDYFGNLETLCDELNIQQEQLINILDSIDYHYNRELNRFV